MPPAGNFLPTAGKAGRRGQQAKTVSKNRLLSLDLHDVPVLHGPPDQTRHVQRLLHLPDLLHMGLRLGVTGGEHRAAVLIGQNGGIEGADMAGDADDLLLIHAEEGWLKPLLPLWKWTV